MSAHGGKIKFNSDHIKLIVASLCVMERDIRHDPNVSASEKEKVYKTSEEIKTLFHNAYFHDPRTVIVDPDGFIPH